MQQCDSHEEEDEVRLANREALVATAADDDNEALVVVTAFMTPGRVVGPPTPPVPVDWEPVAPDDCNCSCDASAADAALVPPSLTGEDDRIDVNMTDFLYDFVDRDVLRSCESLIFVCSNC